MRPTGNGVSEYGVGWWGVGMYNVDSWNFSLEAYRSILAFYCSLYILGVEIRAPNAGVQGELGWYPYSVRAAWQSVAMWTRISRMTTPYVV